MVKPRPPHPGPGIEERRAVDFAIITSSFVALAAATGEGTHKALARAWADRARRLGRGVGI